MGDEFNFKKKYSKSNNFVPNPHYFKDGHLASECLYEENIKNGRMLHKTPDKNVLRFELCECNSAAIFMSTLTDRKYVEIILDYLANYIFSYFSSIIYTAYSLVYDNNFIMYNNLFLNSFNIYKISLITISP